MGAAAFVLVLVGLVIPITLVLLAVVADLLTGAWYVYLLVHDAWSAPTGPVASQTPSPRVAYHR